MYRVVESASGIWCDAGSRGGRPCASWMLPGTLATVQDPMSGYFAIRRSVIEGCTLKPEGYKILLKCWGVVTTRQS